MMGRAYAGILGPIAFVTVVARAIIDGGNAQNTVISAMIALFAFAALGLVVGSIAERLVVEGIETRFRNRLQDAQPSESASDSRQANTSAT